MSIKILATADLHLGKSSADVSGSHASTKYTWQKIINYCIQNNVDVLALCGDIVDWDNRYFEAVRPLQKGLEESEKYVVKAEECRAIFISILSLNCLNLKITLML